MWESKAKKATPKIGVADCVYIAMILSGMHGINRGRWHEVRLRCRTLPT
jgi:hypothetical protein